MQGVEPAPCLFNEVHDLADRDSLDLESPLVAALRWLRQNHPRFAIAPAAVVECDGEESGLRGCHGIQPKTSHRPSPAVRHEDMRQVLPGIDYQGEDLRHETGSLAEDRSGAPVDSPRGPSMGSNGTELGRM